MVKSRYSLDNPDIEKILQDMMDYVYSRESYPETRLRAHSIADLILRDKPPSEITAYLKIPYKTFYKYIDPDLRKRAQIKHIHYKRQRMKEDPEFAKKERDRWKEYQQRPEIKERRREYAKEYSQRPEVKEKQKEYQRKYQRNRLATDPEFRERQREYRKKRYATDPEYRERQNEYRREYQRNRLATDSEFRERDGKYGKACPIACLWRSEEVHDDLPLSDLLTYEELLQRKKESDLDGSLSAGLLDGLSMGYLTEVNDAGTKRYAIDFSSPFFDHLNELTILFE